MKAEFLKTLCSVAGFTVRKWFADKSEHGKSTQKIKLPISPEAYTHDDLRLNLDEQPPAAFDSMPARTRRSYE